jgi:hypothetical protein
MFGGRFDYLVKMMTGEVRSQTELSPSQRFLHRLDLNLREEHPSGQAIVLGQQSA